ncbi:hypothetical protein G5B46_03140 [Caulobacter sp. 602-2]|uniref:Uncharacterized protein n=1 Tax=Caulobacter sp. 602-2 TaxID=2710887 RepID=A0A6G4QT35_9CAUL|nr:hypothetical protein [Caulobacter sp. 602-2]NGM48597.1 hypothetical protein [Caulobacter sp. 602-2]
MTTTTVQATTAVFTTTDCGDTSGTANGLLPVGSSVAINGSTDLSSCIIGNSEGKVYGIQLVPNAGIYSYQVQVDAQGPSGMFSGSINLAFTDQTGDTYKLAITASRREQHTVSYNSDRPSIVKITWAT